MVQQTKGKECMFSVVLCMEISFCFLTNDIKNIYILKILQSLIILSLLANLEITTAPYLIPGCLRSISYDLSIQISYNLMHMVLVVCWALVLRMYDWLCNFDGYM